MFKGLHISTFLDTHQEWHALVNGFSEVLCPWPPRYRPSLQNESDIANEYHYYMLGRAVGILAWLTIGCVIKLMLFDAN
jgi:hypothetical protein